MLWCMAQSWDAMLNLIPSSILILCLANFVLAFYFNCPHKSGFQRKETLLVYSPIVFSLFLTVWGSILGVDNAGGLPTPKWPSYGAIGIYCLQIGCTGYVAYKLKGFRWYSLSFGILAAFYSLGVLFVTGMAVTGDWL